MDRFYNAIFRNGIHYKPRRNFTDGLMVQTVYPALPCTGKPGKHTPFLHRYRVYQFLVRGLLAVI